MLGRLETRNQFPNKSKLGKIMNKVRSLLWTPKVDPQGGSKAQGAKSEGMQQLHCLEVNGILEVERTKVRETNG